MSSVLVLAIIVIVLAVAFDFINGFHDTANAIATVVSTRVLSPGQAVLMAAVLNVVGAFTSTGVAEALAKGIVRPEVVTLDVIIGGLIGAIIWNLFTWYFGVPSSSSHALVGGLAGAAVAAGGISALAGKGFIKIVLSFVISPIAGVIIGLIVLTIMTFFFRNASNSGTNKLFSKLQILSAAAMAFSHGSNDAQKTMGIIATALFAAHFIPTLHPPTWVILTSALAMGLGTSSGGWRIIKTLGHKVVKLTPFNGFAAETSAALVIEAASHLGVPVSTTHVISSTIMSVGLSQGARKVNWKVMTNIGWAMLLTIPASAVVGAIAYLAVHGLIHLLG
ncbi:MAG: anion permease [Mycobacterium leprae]